MRKTLEKLRLTLLLAALAFPARARGAHVWEATVRVTLLNEPDTSN
jgi:hypothetical protein